MAHLNYPPKSDAQYIDTRNQESFQSGHLTGALSLNLSNFKKYGKHLIDRDKTIILILESEEEELFKQYQAISEEQKLPLIEGYILGADIPIEHLEELTTISAAKFMKVTEKYVLLDIRSAEEITRPAPEDNLKSIPLQELAERFNEIDEGLTIYTLCGSGNRATTAASYLKQRGYHVIVIAGGMKAVQAIQKNNF